MKFELSEEQNILKDSVQRFVSDRYELESRRGYLAEENGFSADNWQQMAELGWLSVPFSEAHGGFGGGAVDLMVVMEEFGKGLVVEPYVATVLMFGGALAASNSSMADELLPTLIEGKLQGALAFLERESRYALNDVQTTASESGGQFTLTGEKTVVSNAAAADHIIVVARTSGERFDEQGISLFLVDANASGFSKTEFSLMDGQKVANIKLDNVNVDASNLLGEKGAGLDIIRKVAADTMVALAAEAQGAMQVLFESTVEYSKTREQFGVAIGSFQALQHRMVDMFSACEEHRSMLYRTVCSIDEDENTRDEADIALNIHALKVVLGKSGKYVGGEAMQLHGGMGMTDELSVGHFVKRLMTINTQFGDADYHRRQFAALANAG